jgi:ribosomal protein S1
MYPKGQRVAATVKSTFPFGVFLRLGDGIRAYIRRREPASWEVERPEEMIWGSDDVEAVITHLAPTSGLTI